MSRCNPLSGVVCEERSCRSRQQCALKNVSWGFRNSPDVCELQESLKVSTLTHQKVSLGPLLSYGLMSFCAQMKCCRWIETLCLSLTFPNQGCSWHLMSTRTEFNRGPVDPEKGCSDGVRAGDWHDQSSSEDSLFGVLGNWVLWKL